MRKLLEAGLAEAQKMKLNVKNAIAMGYCFGGGAVLELARSGRDLKGFVTFHGALATPEGQDYKKSKGNFLILHGSADAVITMNQFAALAQELEQNHLSHEMITYGGAPHAFTVIGTSMYRKDADDKSWSRFVDFLAKTTK